MNDVTATAESAIPVGPTAEEKKAAKEAADKKMAEALANVRAKFNANVDVKPVKFSFKTVDLVDDKDNKIGEKKRPTVEIPVPVLSVEGVLNVLNEGLDEQGNPKNSLKLLLEALEDVVIGRAREIINEKEDISADNFPYEALNWDAIANLPRAERRGGGIGKDVWEAMVKDYAAVMPAVTGKSADTIEKHTKIFLLKLQPVKTNKPALKLLKDQLTLYINNTTQAEEFAECVEFLTNKADDLMKMDEEALTANL